jgi:hypothetical protein
MRTAINSVSIVAALALLCGTAAAAPAEDWVDAVKKGRAGGVHKSVSEEGLMYGDTGKDQVVEAKKVKRVLGKAFKKMKKLFKESPVEEVNCTTLSREMAYMAMEWKEKDEEVSEWIRGITDKFCTGEGRPPRFLLLKVISGDIPHAGLIVEEGEDPKITGLYFF